ncbi:conserved repeat domain-containing protein/gliding motility-associated C-terminal domain-containing protein [Spirosomataceae bacterium TFI 002]|nr:conserved repeat domain-containing protein/gliding motility-associated C-terminal domain-containing protein [Spirosomataceae bacterium TFI 002]
MTRVFTEQRSTPKFIAYLIGCIAATIGKRQVSKTSSSPLAKAKAEFLFQQNPPSKNLIDVLKKQSSGKDQFSHSLSMSTPKKSTDRKSIGQPYKILNNMLPLSNFTQTFKSAALALLVLFTLASNTYAVDVDLRLTQSIDKSMPQLGESVKYTYYLVNDGTTNATNIGVESQLALGAITNITSTVNAGSASYAAGTGIVSWSVPSLAAGDSVKLEVFGDVIARGVYFSVAEITSSPDTDIDSSPGNSSLLEDDIATACFSVPLFLYPGDEYTVSIPAPYTYGSGITWYKGGVPITGSTSGAVVNGDNSLTISSVGDYTFSTNISTCPASGCCAIQIIPGPYGSIGDYVWEDVDKDGLQDVGESPIGGVVVELLDGSGGLIASTVTNGSGFYEFDSLLDGNYSVRFTAPTGQEFTVANNPANDALDSDADANGLSPLITISILDSNGNTRDSSDINRFNPTIDAGINTILNFDLALTKKLVSTGPFFPGQTITFDIDVINQGDLNATFVKIVDYIPAGLTLVTGQGWIADGDTARYSSNLSIATNNHTVVPISFVVDASATGTIRNSAEIAEAKGPNGSDVTDIDSTPDDNPTNDGTAKDDVVNEDGKNGGDEDDSDYADIIIGNLAEIGNYVWEDVNANGLNELGESAVSGVIVELLDNNGLVIKKDTTDANGLYLFENLVPGDYAVRFLSSSLPSGFKFTTNNNGTDDTDDSDADPLTGETVTTTLSPGESDLTWDAGIFRPASLGDYVWIDTDKDGVQDLDENGVGGVVVRLEKPDGTLVATQTTNPDGSYLFTNLTPGDYVVVFGKPSGFEPTTPNSINGTDSNDSDADPSTGASPIVTLTSGQTNRTIDAGFYMTEVFDLALRKTSIQTTVVAGAQITFDIEIINQGNLAATNINLVDYIPTGLTLNDINWTATNGTATFNTPISALAAGADTTISITFDVSNAFTGNIQNKAEISSAKGPNGEDVTDVDSTPDSNPSNDGTVVDNVIDQDGKNGGDEDDSDIANITVTQQPIFDLALIKTLKTAQPIYPGSTVVFDIQVINQGTVNATQVAISDYLPTGLTVADANWTQVGNVATYNNALSVVSGTTNTITMTATVSPSATGGLTNSAEISSAKGASGEDVIDIDSTPDNDPTNDGTPKDDVVNEDGKNNSGEDEDDSDIADITLSPLAAIGDYVWNDIDKDGIQDNDESGISGVTVTLLNSLGNTVATTTTDGTGYYDFTGLQPGAYQVMFGKPTGGFIATAQNNPADDATDSDADPVTGRSQLVTLVAGEFNRTIDAGFYSPSCESVLSIVANNSEMCVGESSSLVATTSNNADVNWYIVPSGGSILTTTASGAPYLVQPTTTTIYYAQLGTVTANCPNDRVPVALVVNARPSNPSCGNVIEICTGETTDLNSHIINGITTPGGVFEWHTGAAPTSPIVANPTTVGAGTYYLFEKSGAGCYSNPALAEIVSKSCDQIIDLSLNKVADNRNVEINDVITYTITVNNNGPSVATNVVLEDILPDGLTFVSSTSFTNNANTLTASIASIAVNETKTLTYKATANKVGTLINGAQVKSADQKDSDSTPGNFDSINEDDDDEETIRVTSPIEIADLSLQKIVSNNTPKTDELVNYTIVVTNSGPNIATNVEVEDIIPTGLSYESAAGTDNIVRNGNKVTAKFNQILVGQSVEFTVLTKVTGTGTITNTAQVTKSDQTDPDSTPNSGVNEDDDDAVTITVTNPCNPSTPLVSCANPYICSGESTVITALNCNGTIVWSNGATGASITVAPTTSSIYTARCQVGTCLSNESNPVAVIVNSIAPPFVSANKTTVCSGEAVILTATNCTGTIEWSTGQTGSSITVTPLTNTSYTAVCKVATCISSPSSPVNVNITNTTTPPTIAANKTTICGGESVTLTASSCTGTVTWSTGATGTTLNVSPSSTTTYTATCGNGTCLSPASNAVVVNVGTGSTPTINASKTDVCSGESVTLTIANCSSNVVWSSGATGNSITVNPSVTTTYSVTCGTGTCSANASIVINVGNGNTPTITVANTNICQGQTVTLNGANCTGTLSWSNGATGASITVTPLATTTYTATCGGSSSCSGNASVTISVTPKPAPPIVTCGSERICAGEPLTFTGHDCDGTVTWSTGATGTSMVVNPTVTTTYTATCTVNGCVSESSIPATITVLTQEPTITASSETVCAGTSVTLTAGTCAGTILWNNGSTAASIEVSPTVSTTYSVECTIEGCTGSTSKTINVGTGETPTIAASKLNICGGESVTLTVTNCSQPVNWSTGDSGNTLEVSPTTTTSYTATCGTSTCAGSSAVTINVGAGSAPTISSTTENICGAGSATLTVSGCTGGLTWSTGATTASITVSPTATTTYTVTCGAGACQTTASKSINVTNSENPTLSATKTEICGGESVTITANDCSSNLSWSNGATGTSITVNPTETTTYSVVCSNGGSCQGSSSITINVGNNSNLTPVITVNKSQICNGESATLSAGNCTGSISWSSGQNTATITVSPTATTTYTATCTSGSCTGEATSTITVGTGTTLTMSTDKNDVCTNEAVTISATGCTELITWSNGATGNSITVNPTATTTYTATCGTGVCASTGSVTVNVNANENPVITASKTQLCQTETVTLTASNCSGTPTWSTGQTGNSIQVSVAATTNYTVSCTNSCGTQVTGGIDITVGSPTPPTISSDGSVVCAGSSVNLTAAGCTGTVIWSNGMTGNSITVSPVVKTTYTAVCELQGSNCTSQASNSVAIDVTESPNPPTITCSTTRICVGESVTLTGIGCEGTVNWSNGQTGTSITVSPTETTVYTSTCSIGSCTSALSAPATMNVGKPIPPVVSCQNTLICSGASTVIEAAGCTGEVIWSDGQKGAVITVSPSSVTNYSAICDAGLCQSEISNVVTVAIAGGTGVNKPVVKALMNICPNTSVDLTTAVTSAVSSQGGSFVFRTGNSPNSPAVTNTSSIATSGTFYVFESTGNGCFSAGSQIDVAIIACETNVECVLNPATANAGADTTICLAGDQFQLNGTIGGAAQAGTWTTSGNGTFGNAANAQTTYKFSFEDVVKGDVTLTLTTNDPDNGGPCVAATSSIKININGIKVKPLITSNKSPNICLGDSVQLTATQNAAGYMWSNGATTKTILVKTPGDYTVKLVNEDGCNSVSSDVFAVKINSNIVAPTVVDLAKNTCPATTVDLAQQVTSSPTTENGVFEFRTGVSPTSSIIANVSAMTAGDYYVFEKTPTGCYSSPSQIKVSIDNCDVTEGDADIAITIVGSKSSIVIGDDVVYTITVTNNGPSTATNVKIENTLPAGITPVGGTPNLIQVDNKLKASIPTLAKGETITYTYTGKVTKAGLISNQAQVAGLDQTDPVSSNDFSKFDLECTTCQQTCIAAALKADTLRQQDGSWNIRFTSIVENCGNTNMTGVELLDDLSTMFQSPAAFTIVQQPTVNNGSDLVPNTAYNGSTDTNLLIGTSSTLAPGKIDTVVWVINLTPAGTKGPYSTNAVAKGVGLTIFDIPESVSDVSNDGSIIEKPSGEPTVVRLFNSPSIGLALAISDTTKLNDGSYDVTYKATVKNNGSLTLNNVLLSDTLSTTYTSPASFSVKSIKNVKPTSSLVVNTAYNGNADSKLTMPSSTMAPGQVDTICFVVNVKPATIKEFENSALVEGTGTLDDATTQKVVDKSNLGYNPDAPGSKPTPLIITTDNTNSIQKACVGIALYVADTAKQGNGSYNITYHALIRNCGNVNLKDITLCDTLSNTFTDPSVATLVGKPTLGSGSTLQVDTTFNGVDKTCLLNSANSTLAPNKVDTVKWTVNLVLNSFNGPFRNNVMVTGKTASDELVSDISNNGMDPNPNGSTPTVLNFNNLPQALIGLAKEVEEVKSIGNGKYEVIFNFTVKNYGIKDFERVQVQDNLAATFGDKVIIDSTKVIETSTNFTANDIFTGKGQLIDMLVDSSSTLVRNGAGFVKLWTRVDITQADSAVFENMALAIGYTADSSIDDQSTEGTDPDPEADGTPENNTIPTRVDLGIVQDTTVAFTPLGIAKSVSDTASVIDGSYQVTYKVIVKNFGTRELTNVKLQDSLSAVFSDSTDFGVIGTPTLSAGSQLKLNTSFDGVTDFDMLADSSLLAVGASDTVTFKVKVRNNSAASQTYSNTIFGTALDSTTVVSDKSHSGTLADGNNNNNPGDDNDPTLLTLKSAVDTDTVRVAVIIPGGLSPNGDGLNDKLVISGIRESDNVSMKIYNRWGHLVFMTDNYKKDFPGDSDGWNGSANQGIRIGSAVTSVPDGTYFYQVQSVNKQLFDGKPYYNFLTIAGGKKE